jgi:hypothetical protein
VCKIKKTKNAVGKKIEDLEAWKAARELTKVIYDITSKGDFVEIMVWLTRCGELLSL